MLSRYSLYSIHFYTDAVDYVFSSTVYEFLPADVIDPIPSTVISIPIIPDDVDELDETFKLTIVVSAEARASNIIEGEINMTAVLIKDDNSKTKTTRLASICNNNNTVQHTLTHFNNSS